MLNTYYKNHQIKEDEFGGACNTQVINVYNVLVGRPERKRSIAKYIFRSRNNIKIYLRIMSY
jgi:accessory colonization factor AcfC